MRIIVDLQCCQNASRVRGIGRYALAMTRALAAAGPTHEWLVLLGDRFPETIEAVRDALAGAVAPAAIRVCALPARIAAAELASAWRSRAAEIVRAEYLRALAPDLVFMPSFFEGFHDDVAVSLDTIGCPVAVTVHDFIPAEEPWRYLPTAEDDAAYRRRLRALRGADLILAISSFTAAVAVDLAGLDPHRIVVAPNGVDPALAALAAAAPRAEGPDSVPARLGIDRPFVLNTSPLEHRKNVEGLVAAFGLLNASVRAAHRLVVAGRIDENGRRYLASLAAAAGLPADAVVTTGHLTDADLAALYGQCALFVFPSFSEGFGLPPLEAMACGAAVIAADATSLPEVIGRRDMLIDPADPASLAAAMERVLNDPVHRADLSAYGRERAATFTWEESARIALAAFERLAASRQPAAVSPAWPARVAMLLPKCDDASLCGKAAALAALLPPSTRIDLVGGGGGAGDMLAAVAEQRTLDWFDRHAAAMDAVIYLTTGDGNTDAAVERRMAVHPGVVVRLFDARREIDAAPPAGALVEGRELGILPVVTRTATGRGNAIATPRGDEAWVNALRAALTVARPGLLHHVAHRLPAEVRGVAPTSEDLAQLAIAIATNATGDCP